MELEERVNEIAMTEPERVVAEPVTSPLTRATQGGLIHERRLENRAEPPGTPLEERLYQFDTSTEIGDEHIETPATRVQETMEWARAELQDAIMWFNEVTQFLYSCMAIWNYSTRRIVLTTLITNFITGLTVNYWMIFI